MQPRAKLWLEADGRLVMSDYRQELLKNIQETGSLAAAAERMGLAYRRAWGKVREIEENVGVPLVSSVAGGPGGGGSHLTAEGERLVACYEQFSRTARAGVEAAFRTAFSDWLSPTTPASD